MRPHLAFGIRIGYAFNKSDLLLRPHMQEGEPYEVIRAAAGLRVFDSWVSLTILRERPTSFGKPLGRLWATLKRRCDDDQSWTT